MRITTGALTEDALRLAIPTVGAAAECRGDCDRFSIEYAKLRDHAEANEENAKRDAYALLAAITSLRLNVKDPAAPFRPLYQSFAGRSSSIEDFTDEELDVLQTALPAAENHELAARLADVLWHRRRVYECARFAVEHYLASAKEMIGGEHAFRAIDRLIRARDIAVLLGRSHDCVRLVVDTTAELIDHHAQEPSFVAAHLIGVLGQLSDKDPELYAKLAARLAAEAEREPNWILARELWEHAARWHKHAKDDDARRDALIRAGETFVREAGDRGDADIHAKMVAAHFLRSAITYLQRVPGTKDRRRELHSELLALQDKAVGEMPHFTHSSDISEIVQNSLKRVEGKGPQESIIALALCGYPRSVKEMRQRFEKRADDSILSSMFGKTIQSEAGKVVAHVPPLRALDGALNDQAVRHELATELQLFRSLHVCGVIEPMRHRILAEHANQELLFSPYLAGNPFVPLGRQMFFAQGLEAGLFGKFAQALHLLVPQLENSLRYWLFLNGVIVSGFDADGIQEEYDLNRMLRMPEVDAMLGEDLAFDMRTLLVEKSGPNLRNRIAHGLASVTALEAEPAVYAWWLILHICVSTALGSEVMGPPESSSNDTTPKDPGQQA